MHGAIANCMTFLHLSTHSPRKRAPRFTPHPHVTRPSGIVSPFTLENSIYGKGRRDIVHALYCQHTAAPHCTPPVDVVRHASDDGTGEPGRGGRHHGGHQGSSWASQDQGGAGQGSKTRR